VNKQAQLETIKQAAFEDELNKIAYEVQAYYRSNGNIINRFDSNKNLYGSKPDEYGHYSKETVLKPGHKEYSYADSYLNKQDANRQLRKKQKNIAGIKKGLTAGGIGVGIAGSGLLATALLAKRIKK